MANTEIDFDAFQKSELRANVSAPGALLPVGKGRSYIKLWFNFSNGTKQQDDLTAVIIKRSR